MDHIDNGDKQPDGPLWQGITPADAENISQAFIEGPILLLRAAACEEFREPFTKAANASLAAGDPKAQRIFGLLADVCNLHFKPDNANDPYGPSFVVEDRRSAIPADFRGDALLVLTKLADLIATAPLKARILDVCWLLDRRNVAAGQAAIKSYRETISGIIDGSLKARAWDEGSLTGPYVRDLAERALRMANFKSISLDKQDYNELADTVRELKEIAHQSDDPFALGRFSELCLDYAMEPADQIASQLELWLSTNTGCDTRGRLKLLRLARTAYAKSGASADRDRLRLSAVVQLAEMAEAALAERGSAMVAASLYADAISELHGLPDARERRIKLIARMDEIQENVQDEMHSFSQELDLTEIAESRIVQMEGKSLRDMLFQIALMENSPSPEKLREDALDSIKRHPLTAIFGASFVNRDGQVIYRAPSIDLNSEPTEEALRPTIAQSERLRRTFFARGELAPALHVLNNNYYLTAGDIQVLTANSFAVPTNLAATFSVGITKFLQNEFVAAVYILTPLLEATLKHLLRANGALITKFDSADQTQEDLTISGIFDQMRGEVENVIGAALAADIDCVFLAKYGPCIRHGVAHGLLSDGDPYSPDAAYACWLIFRLCMLPLVQYREQIPEDLCSVQ